MTKRVYDYSRHYEALRLRNEGKTYQQIGDILHVQRERARQLSDKGARLLRAAKQLTNPTP